MAFTVEEDGVPADEGRRWRWRWKKRMVEKRWASNNGRNILIIEVSRLRELELDDMMIGRRNDGDGCITSIHIYPKNKYF